MAWDDHLPEVAGRRMLKSHTQFERQCRLLLKEEQEKIAPDNNLVDALCDAMTLNRMLRSGSGKRITIRSTYSWTPWGSGRTQKTKRIWPNISGIIWNRGIEAQDARGEG